MKFGAKFDAKRVLRATLRVRRRIPVITAQELNRQRKQSRTRMTRGLSSATGIKPQKRIRRRILLTRPGNATPKNLEAGGLTLFSSFPGRYFPRGLPAGAVKKSEPEGQVDRKGRRTVGRSFEATMKNGHRGTFRRLSAGSLPIRDVGYISLEGIGYDIRQKVLIDLAKEFPDTWEKRMRRETRRAFR